MTSVNSSTVTTITSSTVTTTVTSTVTNNTRKPASSIDSSKMKDKIYHKHKDRIFIKNNKIYNNGLFQKKLYHFKKRDEKYVDKLPRGFGGIRPRIVFDHES